MKFILSIAIIMSIVLQPMLLTAGTGHEDSLMTGVKAQLLAQTSADADLSVAIERALAGYQLYSGQEDLNGKLVVIDFTKPSFDERLYIFDIENITTLYQKHVAHGKNSGLIYPKYFSNTKHSNTSSLGFFRTAETYHGKHGLSLRLDGLEEDVNHNARSRAIVIHSAAYANPPFLKKYGRLGRSYGCPALPEKDYLEILDIVKEGALLYIHYPDQVYFQKSKI